MRTIGLHTKYWQISFRQIKGRKQITLLNSTFLSHLMKKGRFHTCQQKFLWECLFLRVNSFEVQWECFLKENCENQSVRMTQLVLNEEFWIWFKHHSSNFPFWSTTKLHFLLFLDFDKKFLFVQKKISSKSFFSSFDEGNWMCQQFLLAFNCNFLLLDFFLEKLRALHFWTSIIS